GLKGSPHCNFSLPEADVSTNQPIHGQWLLHIGLYLVDTPNLILSLLIGEGRLELNLPFGILRKRESCCPFATAIQTNEVLGKLFDLLLDARLSGFPGFSAELVEPGVGTLTSNVFLYEVYLLDGNEHRLCIRVLEL